MNGPDRCLSEALQIYHKNFSDASEQGRYVRISEDQLPTVVEQFSAMQRNAKNLEDRVFQYEKMIEEAQEKALAEGRFNAADGETVQ